MLIKIFNHKIYKLGNNIYKYFPLRCNYVDIVIIITKLGHKFNNCNHPLYDLYTNHPIYLSQKQFHLKSTSIWNAIKPAFQRIKI